MQLQIIEFAKWLERQAHIASSVELKEKIRKGEDLTADEIEKSSFAILLIAVAQILYALVEVIRMLNRMDTTLRSMRKTLGFTLYEASGQNPMYKPGTRNGISPVKDAMVRVAISMLIQNNTLSERAVCNKIIQRFSDVSEAYHDVEVFRKQVRREMENWGQ